jgi:hypothetical protein
METWRLNNQYSNLKRNENEMKQLKQRPDAIQAVK